MTPPFGQNLAENKGGVTRTFFGGELKNDPKFERKEKVKNGKLWNFPNFFKNLYSLTNLEEFTIDDTCDIPTPLNKKKFSKDLNSYFNSI